MLVGPPLAFVSAEFLIFNLAHVGAGCVEALGHLVVAGVAEDLAVGDDGEEGSVALLVYPVVLDTAGLSQELRLPFALSSDRDCYP